MDLKSVLSAAAVAVILPAVASAATFKFMEDGGVYDVSEADEFVYDETFTGTEGDVISSGQTLDFTFTNDVYGYSVVLNASTTVNAQSGDSSPDATAGFGSEAIDLGDNPGSANFFSTLLDPNEEVTFFVRLGELTPLYNVDISIIPTPVPVPAAGFLLLGGLGGLAMMRRRKTS